MDFTFKHLTPEVGEEAEPEEAEGIQDDLGLLLDFLRARSHQEASRQ